MLVKVVYPPHVINIKEIKLILDAGDKVGNMAEDDTAEINDNLTVLTSRLSGIERREKILGIIPKASDTLEDRRLRVHLRWYNKDFYTERTLIEKLNSVLGKNNYVLNIDLDKKTVSVLIELARTSMRQSIEKLLDDIVPMDYLFSVSLRYNTWEKVKAKTWEYWRTRTWGDMKEGVIE